MGFYAWRSSRATASGHVVDRSHRDLPDQWLAPAASDVAPSESDDTLIVLFMCCHPSLSAASQIALTLRAVGGVTTAEIARAFLVPEATMTPRITRAKQTIKDSGVAFGMPAGSERPEPLGAVLHALYLIFNEGNTAASGLNLQRAELSADAIRLARMVHRLLPDDSEVTGLLALMLLTDGRRPARTGPDGGLAERAPPSRRRPGVGAGDPHRDRPPVPRRRPRQREAGPNNHHQPEQQA